MENKPEELVGQSDQQRYEAAIALNNQGLVKYKNVDFDDAIADYTNALKICPDLAVALFNRGTVHYRIGDFQLAFSDLSRATELEPDNPEFKEGLNECIRLMQQQNPDWEPSSNKSQVKFPVTSS